jgi:hypothetical protein
MNSRLNPTPAAEARPAQIHFHLTYLRRPNMLGVVLQKLIFAAIFRGVN